ncbi:TetR/AcrR family transcriptional regulator [Saccharothrix variisporea]|uniref:TetR family transcriptional regulator n=1 Tax=Saccharothrix variisporea TaxID=543527 RepID=A0A495X486_9PSEU|nr:TetR/AcrR family transcriptional regulator [Saccharothrix variisporea]RKT68717.1 TetR family transcriptional regulator [Saccharothrix variisporea]
MAQGARTRAALVAAGIDLFDRDGYEGTSLDAVCRSVSVTKGALYRHFPSKQALAVAVVEEYFRRWHLVRADCETGVGPLQALVDLTHRMAELTATDPTVRVGVRLLFTTELFDLLAGLHFTSLTTTARELLREAAAAGELNPNLDPRREAEAIVSAVVGIQVLTVITGKPTTRLSAAWHHRLAHLVPPARRSLYRVG